MARAEARSIGERTDGDDVRCARRLEKPVGRLKQISGIFGDALFDGGSAAGNPVTCGDKDQNIELAGEFIKRGRPRSDPTGLIACTDVTE